MYTFLAFHQLYSFISKLFINPVYTLEYHVSRLYKTKFINYISL